MEENRIRETLLSEVYPDKGERRIRWRSDASSWDSFRLGHELSRVYLHLSSSQGPAKIRDRGGVHPLW